MFMGEDPMISFRFTLFLVNFLFLFVFEKYEMISLQFHSVFFFLFFLKYENLMISSSFSHQCFFFFCNISSLALKLIKTTNNYKSNCSFI